MIKGLLAMPLHMQAPIDPESPVVRQVTREAVHVGMNSPLRETILEAVDEAEGVETATPDEKSTATKVIQGAVVFAIMFAVLYLTLRYLSASGESEE